MSEPRELDGAGLVRRGVSESAGIVTRPAGRWTPSVHHLLNWLRSAGYPFAPRPICYTPEIEQLEFLPGRDQGWPFIDDLQSVAGAFECGAFVRGLTDLLARYPCPKDAVWQSVDGPPGEGMQVQHGDLGPWNLLWSPSGPSVCGVIDWDQAEPGYPTYDVGFLAWFTVPVMDDERARARGFSTSPNRPLRLRAFADGVGWEPAQLLREINRAQQEFVNRVVGRGIGGERGSVWVSLHHRGFQESAREDLQYARQRMHEWLI